MFFATRAQAAVAGSEAPVVTSGGTPSAEQAATDAAAVGGTPAAQTPSGEGSAGAAQAPAGSGEGPAPVQPPQPVSAPPAQGSEGGGPPGAPANGTHTPVPADAVAAVPTPAPGAPAAAGAGDTSAPAQTGGAAAALLQAERQAEAITTSWPAPASAEQPPAIKLTRDLQELIAQFESFARDSHGASPGAAADISAATTMQEQLPVTIVGDSPAPPPDALGPGGVPAPPAPDAVPTSPAVLAWAADSVSDRLDPLATVRPILHRSATGSSAAWGANPTVSSSSPSGAGAALGGGANGLTAPGGALLVMVAACLLGTRLLGRRTTDPTLWRSALLNLRLERPG